jgi:predicted MPP superfamily phosphohydrolase
MVYFGATSVVIAHMMTVLKPFAIKWVIMSVFIILGVAITIGRWSPGLPLSISAFFVRIGFVWMGLLTYLTIWSAVFLILKRWVIHPLSDSGRIAFFLAEVALFTVIFLIGNHIARDLKLAIHELQTDKNASIRAVQITDLHIGNMNTERHLSKIVDMINTVNPDIILITGDFMENENKYATRKNIGQSMKRLNPPLGVWAITGNHEYIAGIESSITHMKSLGINILRDESVIIDDRLLLIGREDPALQWRENKTPLSLTEILSHQITDEKTTEELSHQMLTILMTHQERTYKEYAGKSIDLILSGHTHAGQFFPWNIVANRMFEIGYGLVKRDNTYIYVSSGTGIWGPPFRLGTRSEIVVFDIR